jgi:hypothetical protein
LHVLTIHASWLEPPQGAIEMPLTSWSCSAVLLIGW